MRPQPIEGGFIIAAVGEADEGDSIAARAFAVAIPLVFLEIDEQAAMIGKVPFVGGRALTALLAEQLAGNVDNRNQAVINLLYRSHVEAPQLIKNGLVKWLAPTA